MDRQEIKHEGGTVEVTLDTKPLLCPICGNDRFHERGSLLNTRAGEFFGFAWADDNATNFICTKCKYILWFLV